jgi:hypothetical protein
MNPSASRDGAAGVAGALPPAGMFQRAHTLRLGTGSV